ncbi:hypothetical protein FQA39_LY01564 [Lamprigera yunnana]|nr:hypothetical protein FQA39_LY01564 [Lamprigera yunnana]
MIRGDGQPRVMCPYDPSHVILEYRIQNHLVKCRKNFPNKEMVPCSFNSTHEIPVPELAFHHDHCKDRIRLDKFIYTKDNDTEEKFPIPEINVPVTEVWDDDNYQSYNPEMHCIENAILRRKDNLSKAKKVVFRREERERMQQIDGNKPVTEDAKESNFHRRPTTLSKGLQNSNNDVVEDDVSDMLRQIKLRANTAIIPITTKSKMYNDALKNDSTTNGTADYVPSDVEVNPFSCNFFPGNFSPSQHVVAQT